MKTLRYVAMAAVMVLGLAVAAAAAAPTCNKKVNSFDFVVDYSGSMMMQNKQLKLDKIVVAKNVLQRVNSSIPALDFTGGLHTITPNGVIIPQGPWDRAAMSAGIDQLKTSTNIFGRMTGLGDGLQKYEPFISAMQAPSALILVTDGDNNRGINVVDEIRQLYASQRDLTIHIISLADNAKGEAIIKEIAALNPNTIVVSAEELATSDAAVERFVLAVFCQDEDVIVLRGVHFAFNSYALDSKAQGILNEAATIIKDHPNQKVILKGWTDYIGSDAYNKVLSQNRANAVKNYLEKQGIPASRMTAIGCGKSFKYDNHTEEGRYMNRRVEISFE